MIYTKNTFLEHIFKNIPEYKEYWLDECNALGDDPVDNDRTIFTEAATLSSFTINMLDAKQERYLPFT